MRELLSIKAAEKKGAPDYVIEAARRRKAKVLHIVWDEADGYPPHACGYEQWSPRPFVQGQGCDGTIDHNVHLIGLRFCAQLGLDYAALYEEAYAWTKEVGHPPGSGSGDWLRNFADEEDTVAQTIIPPVSFETLRLFLEDLTDINNYSLVEVMEREFVRLNWGEAKAA